jgi:RNA polymerase sigma-70 factor (ECF subfamily)
LANPAVGPHPAPGFVACARAFEAEFDYVYRSLRRMGARPAEAEDLAQDVFLVLWRRWGTYQPDRPLRPWLTGIAQHVAIDHFRRHSRREVASGAVEAQDETPDPEQQLAATRARALALEALAALSEPHRVILIQHDLEGVPIREIAAGASLPFFTAAARLRRARLRFARAVKKLQPRPALVALTPAKVLEGERAVPRVPEVVRTRMRGRLGQGVGRSSPAPDALEVGRMPVAPGSPLAPALAAIAAAVLLLLLTLWLRPAPDGGDRPAPVGARVVDVSLRPRAAPRPPPPRLAAAAAPAAPAAVSPAPDTLARGLVAHWRFEDGAGSPIARDASGHRRDCLLHEMDPATAWVLEPGGGALDLGERGWLECPLPEARAGQPVEMSVALWIKRTRASNGAAALVTRQLPSGDARHLFWFGLLNSQLRVWSGAWTGWATGKAGALDSWTHVAFVHAERSTRLYLNGRLIRHHQASRPRGEGLVQSALTIGGARFVADPLRVRNHFFGLVDEVLVHDRALGDAEITTLAAQR